MKLIYTPRSHFARKVRILLDAMNAPITLVDAGNVQDIDAKAFGNHPLMMVPTLLDGDVSVYDSDNIAAYLVAKHDDSDAFQVNLEDVNIRNARVVMNGVMAAEVEVILAKRSGLDVDSSARFAKKLEVIRNGLQWLEDNASVFEGAPSYAGFHLVALWDHLTNAQLVEMMFPKLADIVSSLSAHAFIAKSRPPAPM